MNKILKAAFYGALVTIGVSCAQKTSSKESITLKKPLEVDLSHYPNESPTYLEKFVGTNPSGETIRVNNKYVEINGVPWIPSYGEFHFSRYPAELWEQLEGLYWKDGSTDLVKAFTF